MVDPGGRQEGGRVEQVLRPLQWVGIEIRPVDLRGLDQQGQRGESSADEVQEPRRGGSVQAALHLG